jgi:hypothetical protein
MDEIRLTRHASYRIRNRAIPRLMLDWLLDYGDRVHDHRGAEVLYFGKAAIRRLERAAGKQIVDRIGHYRNAYLVLADGLVVTSGYRTKPIKH